MNLLFFISFRFCFWVWRKHFHRSYPSNKKNTNCVEGSQKCSFEVKASGKANCITWTNFGGWMERALKEDNRCHTLRSIIKLQARLANSARPTPQLFWTKVQSFNWLGRRGRGRVWWNWVPWECGGDQDGPGLAAGAHREQGQTHSVQWMGGSEAGRQRRGWLANFGDSKALLVLIRQERPNLQRRERRQPQQRRHRPASRQWPEESSSFLQIERRIRNGMLALEYAADGRAWRNKTFEMVWWPNLRKHCASSRTWRTIRSSRVWM